MDGPQQQIELFIFSDATSDGYQLKPLQYNLSDNSINNCGFKRNINFDSAFNYKPI